MRTRLFLFCLVSAMPAVIGQLLPQIQGESQTIVDVVQQVGRPGEGFYAVTEAGPHHRRWERIVHLQREDGTPDSRLSSYVELGTGLHVWSEIEQKWVEADPTIEIFEEAAVARNTQHKVLFAANLRNENGTVDLLTPSGLRLRSSVVGLAYTETDTGKSVFIAEVKDTQGAVVGDNQVIYEDAFDSVKADIRYTTTRALFEADVILRESPPSPEAFGLNPETSRLEVWTEFYDPPIPETATVELNRGQDQKEADEILKFGTMQMVTGKAFSLHASSEEGPQAIEQSDFIVTKEWAPIDGQTFLVESLPYLDVKAGVDVLPRAQVKGPIPVGANQKHQVRDKGSARKKPMSLAQGPRSLPKRRLFARNDGFEKAPGFVLDWTVVSTQSDFTFEAKKTYLIQAEVYLSGMTTFEGGAVIKFTKSTGPPSYVWIAIYGPSRCKTSFYRPLILTAIDDNTVGETITGSTGTPTGHYSLYGLAYRYGSDTVSHVKANHIYKPYSFYYGTGYVLNHAQAVNSFVAVDTYGADVHVRNMLVNNSTWVHYGPGPGQSYTSTGYFEHLTVNQAYNLNGNGHCYITNSLLVDIVNFGTFYGANNAITNSTPPVFQTAGAGTHYLPVGSPYRNLGTTNINRELLSALSQTTTYAPLVVTNSITTDSVWSKYAQRDVDLPDLGYHYPALDYLVGNVLITNATLLITNSAAVAGFNDYAFRLANPSRLIIEGHADSLARLGRYTAVQEAIGTNLWKSSFTLLSASSTATPRPEVNGAFSELTLTDYMPLGDSSLVYRLRDCDVLGGYMAYAFWTGTNGAIHLTNSVWSVDISSCEQLHKFYARNCLFRKINPFFVNPTVALWEVRDNLFDNVRFFTGTSISNSHNAYVNCTGRLQPTNSTDVLPASIAYTQGPLGPYYYASTTLKDLGSRTAGEAGLYHYTTSTSQTKETNSVVDIGIHYPSLISYDSDNSFSGTQGANNWRYQRTTSLGGLPDLNSPDLPSYDPNPGYAHWHYDAGDSYCHIWDTGLHPGNLYDSVRTFVCPQAGLIRINGVAHDGHYGAGSDGTRARIIMSGTELLKWRQITEGSVLTNAIPLNVSAVAVGAGTRIHFQLNKNTSNSYDSTAWLPLITYLGPGVDKDGDGMPDIFEDRNGNGVFDSSLGETDWQTSDSAVGTAAGLQVWTPLRY